MPEYRLDRSPGHLLHRARQCAEAIFVQRAARRDCFGLPIGSETTPRQLAVLLTVADNEGLDQMGIARHTGIDRTTTADLVGRLVRRGLLRRRRSRSDTRSYVLKVTDEGRRAIDAAAPPAATVDTLVLDALPKERQEAFLACLAAIVSRLEAPPDTRARRPAPARRARGRS